MPWIRVIPPESAEGRLADIYSKIAGPGSQVDNVLSIHSLRPRTLDAHLSLYKAAMHSAPCDLSLRERELLGSYVSWVNRCDYCIDHHLAGLGLILGNPALARRLMFEADGAPGGHLTQRERAMLAYAKKLTLEPSEMRKTDLAAMRALGMSDDAILDVNQVVAYFAYVNRTVLGLGVSVDGETLGLHPGEGEGELRHR